MIKTGILACVTANDVKEKDVDQVYWKLVAFKNSIESLGCEATISFNVNQYPDNTPLVPPEPSS